MYAAYYTRSDEVPLKKSLKKILALSLTITNTEGFACIIHDTAT
jgi:hypothetical protein